MDEHDIEEEPYRDSRGRKRLWLDCSCGWFHAAMNKKHAVELKELHQKYPEGIPADAYI